MIRRNRHDDPPATEPSAGSSDDAETADQVRRDDRTRAGGYVLDPVKGWQLDTSDRR